MEVSQVRYGFLATPDGMLRMTHLELMLGIWEKIRLAPRNGGSIATIRRCFPPPWMKQKLLGDWGLLDLFWVLGTRTASIYVWELCPTFECHLFDEILTVDACSVCNCIWHQQLTPFMEHATGQSLRLLLFGACTWEKGWAWSWSSRILCFHQLRFLPNYDVSARSWPLDNSVSNK